ncbi:MAG: phosphatase PAP2 family protein [Nocardioidaceae bacterium]
MRSIARVAREVVLLAVLYVGYSLARLLASNDTRIALDHATDVVQVERWWHISIELSWNSMLAQHEALSVFSGYWYATMHYIVTPIVLVLLWRHSRSHYLRMRRVLVGASAIALVAYIFYPTAPPRMMDGYVDVLSTTSQWGWWGASASAPRGLGSLTNELAAMPSMHVGWALWVTIAVMSLTRVLWVRISAVAYVLVTTAVVVTTGNHWILDAVVGAAITAAAWLVVRVASRGHADTESPRHLGAHVPLPVAFPYPRRADAAPAPAHADVISPVLETEPDLVTEPCRM